MLSDVLTVDAIQKIVQIAILLKFVEIAHGRNVVVGLTCMSNRIAKITPIYIIILQH
jgi:hypothetical protein